MDTLQISGKWYVSSRRAAKEHGYHSDYIGQLIRSGKVKGQKVGRSWYVLADSLTDYLDTPEGRKTASATPAKIVEEAPVTATVEDETIAPTPLTEIVEEPLPVVQPAEEEKETEVVEEELPKVIVHEKKKITPAPVVKFFSKKVPDLPPITKEHALLTYLKEDEDSADGENNLSQKEEPIQETERPVKLSISPAAPVETTQKYSETFKKEYKTPDIVPQSRPRMTSQEEIAPARSYSSRSIIRPILSLLVLGILILLGTVAFSLFFSYTITIG